MDITPFLPLITGALGGATTVGVFKGPIQTLEDLWYINFGYKSSDKVAQLREKQAINIEKLRDETIAETAKIHPDNIQEPKLSIIGPTLEASQYYIEEEELRSLFSKLLASSMDKSKNKILHPSFVEIIKQLSPEDALFLKEFKNSSRIPFGKILSIENRKKKEQTKNNTDSTQRFNKISMSAELKDMGVLSVDDWTSKYGSKSKSIIDYFYFSKDRPDLFDNELSISSLSRLGLVTPQEGIILSSKLIYSELESEFEMLKKQPFFSEGSDINPKNFHLELRKGAIDLTPFGASFFDACI